MSFEEFFTKKKINLPKFREHEEALCKKLENEYAEMGAKSFDHFYKFLFNKWRRKYLN